MINKKILITGADGFIGSHLTEFLCKKYESVTALVLYNSFATWGWLDQIDSPSNLKVILGDIRDPFLVKELMKDVDIVFHLAALIGIPYSYVAPQSYIETNVSGTLNILEAAREFQTERILITSTSEVYGSAQYVPIDELHPIVPQSPYAASKVGADSLAMSYYKSFDVPVSIVRPFNTYGPRQSARAIIPTIIGQVASGASEIKLGNLSPTRDLTFVLDTCKGFYEIANEKRAIGETFNVGSSFEISMKDLVYKILHLMKADHVKINIDQDRIRPNLSEVDRLFANVSKIRDLTQFECEYNLDRGLLKTIEFFRSSENLKKYKINSYNI
ncbi:GDP-mannose 4,6-dehydratase [bacterium]|nr:GDP-mannose 4,6-dehydratase [bacterium]